MAKIEFKAAMMVGGATKVFRDGVLVGRVEKRNMGGARKWQFIPDESFNRIAVPREGFDNEAAARAHVEKHIQ